MFLLRCRIFVIGCCPMKTLSNRFTMNADKCGPHIFQLNRRDGDIALYDRINPNTGSRVGIEVFKVKVVKAGTPLPNGEVVKEDYESYPGGASFGKHAMFCMTEEHAERAVAKLRGQAILGDDTETEVVEFTPLAADEKPAKVAKPRSSARPATTYQFPTGTWSVKDLMRHNDLDVDNASSYQLAANWVRGESNRPDGAVVFAEAKKLTAGPGKKTNFFKVREVKSEIVQVEQNPIANAPVVA